MVEVGRADGLGVHDPWIAAVLATGVVLALMLVGEVVVLTLGLRPVHDAYAVGAVSSLVPILWLLYGAHRVASGPLPPARYRRIALWCLGAGGAFLGLNVVIMASLPPESTMEALAWVRWAASLGAGAGLLVGIFEARAIERTRRAERLSVERREAERRNEVLEEFASVVSHDLRNPLNVAVGRLELARDAVGDGDGTARSHIEDAEAALERMASIIDETLLLAREGQTVGSTEPVPLAELARSSWSVVETRDAELVLEDPPTVEADPDRLRHVVENLFRNAVRHGGRAVTVRVGALPDGDGFYVEDDGSGFDGVDDEADVFESGFTTSDDGTGLGLSIVRRIAEAHGWSIRATVGDADGARFEIAGVEPHERAAVSAPL